MYTTSRALSIQFEFLVSGLCVLLLAALAMLPTQATVSALPPRPTPLPTPVVETAAAAPGALIKLNVQPVAQPALWTVVQWQDHLGNWHDVEGWRGTLDEVSNGVGKKVWWVARANFDTGPFRWVIYQSQGGKLLAASGNFYLPRDENTAVVIEVSLK